MILERLNCRVTKIEVRCPVSFARGKAKSKRFVNVLQHKVFQLAKQYIKAIKMSLRNVNEMAHWYQKKGMERLFHEICQVRRMLQVMPFKSWPNRGTSFSNCRKGHWDYWNDWQNNVYASHLHNELGSKVSFNHWCSNMNGNCHKGKKDTRERKVVVETSEYWIRSQKWTLCLAFANLLKTFGSNASFVIRCLLRKLRLVCEIRTNYFHGCSQWVQ